MDSLSLQELYMVSQMIKEEITKRETEEKLDILKSFFKGVIPNFVITKTKIPNLEYERELDNYIVNTPIEIPLTSNRKYDCSFLRLLEKKKLLPPLSYDDEIKIKYTPYGDPKIGRLQCDEYTEYYIHHSKFNLVPGDDAVVYNPYKSYFPNTS